MKGISLLLYLNKSEHPKALTVEEIKESYELDKIHNRAW
jgi:hypothetical protein